MWTRLAPWCGRQTRTGWLLAYTTVPRSEGLCPRLLVFFQRKKDNQDKDPVSFRFTYGFNLPFLSACLVYLFLPSSVCSLVCSFT